MDKMMVSYGGGINSTAMLVGMVERGIRPDAILFADTGGEHPYTYEFVQTVSDYCVKAGLPAITILKYAPRRAGSVAWTSLEQECLSRGQLPSLAYGWHKCAAKWKARPQMEWIAKNGDGTIWRKAIGFHLGEQHRRKDHIQDPGTLKFFPLIEWRWAQEDCVAAVARAGLPLARKSSCFFCPASTKHEVRRLARESPELFDRALAIENAAVAAGNLETVVGLGRHWTWRSVAAAQDGQLNLFQDSTEAPCGCYDGEDD
jgi:hypothetical protein